MKDIRKEYVKNNGLSWSVGGLFTHDVELIPLFTKLSNNDIKVPIDSIYGAPADCILGGGRSLFKVSFNRPYESIIEEYLNLNISCRLTYTNTLIDEKSFKDVEANKLLKFLNDNQCNSSKNGVIVFFDKLKDYIRDKYPNLEVISSFIKPSIEVGLGNDNIDYYNKLLDEYDIVVLNPGFIKKTDDLQFLHDIQKIELLVNSKCALNCPYAGRDFNMASDDILHPEKRAYHRLRGTDDQCFRYEPGNVCEDACFTLSELEKAIVGGITKYKLEGRTWNINWLLDDLNKFVIDESNYLNNIIETKN